MKKIIFSLTVTLFFMNACNRKQDDAIEKKLTASDVLKLKTQTQDIPVGEAMTRSAIDKSIFDIMEVKHDFKWEWADLKTTWSALQSGNNALAIGYKPAGVNNVNDIIHEIDIQQGEWEAVHDALIDFVVAETNKVSATPVTAADVVIEDDPDLPIIIFNVTSKEVLTKLVNLENVRYAEPIDYFPQAGEPRSTSGCSASGEPLNSADWTNISPGCLLPWNFSSVGIPQAWDNSPQGAGITVGIIDAGISSSQSLLGSDFNNGASNVGRQITTAYTFGSSAYTNCDHGNSMSGLAVGPRNNLNSSTGVAYKSSLYFIRGCEDVALDGSAELSGVKSALVSLGKNRDVKIISMSIGTPFYSGVLYDGVTFAYGKGKLIFAAAGTSYSWTTWYGVIYPAAHSQCVAVTGVTESSSTCEYCHDGSEVDFTIPMERNANTERNSLTIPSAGYTPVYIGGSSCATATAAGIAAVVWSVKPRLSRDQVLTCLRVTSQYYPGSSSSKGYGNINAAAAVNQAATY